MKKMKKLFTLALAAALTLSLAACGAQGVRAADCKTLSESPKGDFRQTEPRPNGTAAGDSARSHKNLHNGFIALAESH